MMQTAFENLTHGNVTLPAAMADYRSVQFRTQCQSPQPYLFIENQDGSMAQLHQMDKAKEGKWDLSLRLKPGNYRFRYLSTRAKERHNHDKFISIPV